MQTQSKHVVALLVAGVMTILSLPASATVTATYLVNHTSANFYDSSIGVNLLTSGQSSLASVTVPTGSLFGIFPSTGVNDGSASANNKLTYYSVMGIPGDGGAATLMPDTITFLLTQGYDITSVEAFSGWGDHNLGMQKFDLLLSIGGGAFASYGTFTNTGIITTGNSAAGAYRTTITDTGGIIASNVTGIRFVFSNPDTGNGVNAVGSSQLGGSGSAGGTVIRELEAFGTPTPAPEPTRILLLGIAGTGLLMRRRRTAR
ncbi:MAG: PEP-CTERM sorting domain-containing protein [Verrucomicrobiaceae bacterium]|nr:PEP-CTERM sorting domain-containing protein [Verrucomicrobiaceae bacterium]